MTNGNAGVVHPSVSTLLLVIGAAAGAYGANVFLVTPGVPTSSSLILLLMLPFAALVLTQIVMHQRDAHFMYRILAFWFQAVVLGGLLFLAARGLLYMFN